MKEADTVIELLPSSKSVSGTSPSENEEGDSLESPEENGRHSFADLEEGLFQSTDGDEFADS